MLMDFSSLITTDQLINILNGELTELTKVGVEVERNMQRLNAIIDAYTGTGDHDYMETLLSELATLKRDHDNIVIAFDEADVRMARLTTSVAMSSDQQTDQQSADGQ